jgi:hypothetical protein
VIVAVELPDQRPAWPANTNRPPAPDAGDWHLMAWIVWVGTSQHPPEPLFRFRTREEAARWAGRLQAMAEIKGLRDASVFIRPGEGE